MALSFGSVVFISYICIVTLKLKKYVRNYFITRVCKASRL